MKNRIFDAPLMLPESTNNRRTRAERIHAAAHTGKLYSAPDATITLYATCHTGRDLIAAADRKTAATLAYMAKCGEATALDLAKYRAADNLVFDLARIWEEADAERAAAAALLESEDYQNAERIRNRISTPDEQREALTTYTDSIRAEASNHIQQALTIERRAAKLTNSPRADLVMVAAAAMVLHGEHAPQVTAAIRKAIRNEKSRATLDRATTEILRAATDEDKSRHSTFIKGIDEDGKPIIVFEALPYVSRKGTADGYTNIEHKPTKTDKNGEVIRKEGLYLVHHRQTAKQLISFESYTDPENGHDLPDTNEGNAVILVQWDWARLEKLFDRANLSQTDRAALMYVSRTLSDPNSQKDGETSTAWIERAWKNALRNVGIYAKDSQSQTREAIEGALTNTEKSRLHRLRAKLNKARAQMEQDENQSQTATAVDMLAWCDAQTVPTWAEVTAADRITYGTDRHGKPQHIRFAWKETCNAAEAVTLPKVFTPTCDSQTATRAAHKPTQAERDEARQNAEYWTKEEQRDSRRAARLEPIAEAAEQTARAAEETAQKYSKTDRSEAARSARRAAAEATRAAEAARARATDARREAAQSAKNAAFYTAIATR